MKNFSRPCVTHSRKPRLNNQSLRTIRPRSNTLPREGIIPWTAHLNGALRVSHESIEFSFKDFPNTRYCPKLRLRTWYPTGVLNERLSEKVIEFIESEEYLQEAPFDHYIDFSGLTGIRTTFEHILKTARLRIPVRQPVKTAIYGDNAVNLAIAQTYECLMQDAVMITVRAFDQREASAEWLEVPVAVTFPPSQPDN